MTGKIKILLGTKGKAKRTPIKMNQKKRTLSTGRETGQEPGGRLYIFQKREGGVGITGGVT